MPWGEHITPNGVTAHHLDHRKRIQPREGSGTGSWLRRPSNTLARLVSHRERIVLATDRVLADAHWPWWPAPQLGR